MFPRADTALFRIEIVERKDVAMTTTSDLSVGVGCALAQGKTKIIFYDGDGDVLVQSKDDITAGDGAKHDLIKGKAALSTRTTSNVFRLLKACGIPVAFKEQTTDTAFLAKLCKMLPYEVVVRREAHGSFIKRNPGLTKGHLFPKLLVEFYLKTKGRRWNEHTLLCDDPLIVILGGKCRLYEASKQLNLYMPFLELDLKEIHEQADNIALLDQMDNLARCTFLVLEKAWQILGRKIVDFKVEFGTGPDGELLLADVIDNDSWRVIEDGRYIDKQVYRDGGSLDEVTEKYRRVADLTDRFVLPKQRIVVWSGSDKDADGVRKIVNAIVQYVGEGVPEYREVVRSVHKKPVQAIEALQDLLQEVPDSVVIAYIGRSNGAGPVLSAATTTPVITVPASVKDFPDDVWSSLRTPSDVPVMTILEPSNAALAALNILSARNPLIYMRLREKLEERFDS